MESSYFKEKPLRESPRSSQAQLFGVLGRLPFLSGLGVLGYNLMELWGGGLQYKLIQWAVDLGRQGLCAKACVGASWPHKLYAGSEEGNREV